MVSAANELRKMVKDLDVTQLQELCGEKSITMDLHNASCIPPNQMDRSPCIEL